MTGLINLLPEEPSPAALCRQNVLAFPTATLSLFLGQNRPVRQGVIQPQIEVLHGPKHIAVTARTRTAILAVQMMLSSNLWLIRTGSFDQLVHDELATQTG